MATASRASSPRDSPTDAQRVALGGGILAPGFIDLQVNGGGGALLNLTPDVPTIETICGAFAQFGTTAALPTMITDTPEKTAAAVAAGEAAATKGVRGFLGLHLEGPHLERRPQGRARPGADPADGGGGPRRPDRGAPAAPLSSDHRGGRDRHPQPDHPAHRGRHRRQHRPLQRLLRRGEGGGRRGREHGDASVQRPEPVRQS